MMMSRNDARVGAAAPLAIAVAAPVLTSAAGWLTYRLGSTTDWSRWTPSDAAAVGIGVLATVAGLRFVTDVASAWRALRRGRPVPARTGRLAAAAAGSLLALLAGTGAATASTETPPVGWLPVEHTAPSPSPSASAWTTPLGSGPPEALRAPAGTPPSPGATPTSSVPSGPSVPPPTRTSTSTSTGDATQVHVVVAGDSLWRITAALLGDGPSDARIAEAWPDLYRANRAAIGDDPGMISVGMRLEVPPTLGGGR
ncbi:hypothetical protein QQX13_05035 [Demequina sp. SYSU T00068]|uniref:LysM peptidoglycan-binding domain-containing protein n=1 Tax=Demequina lignilytica TaxID=3051663 RepID=UPI00260B6224|nr:LysM peptidoglycan-binding domain-containing protein [Demequina sp. SYSU T00068]MDN4490189.1 hypothetical protein [Demequina sp. SYSU T00068]